jgi:hypothetical protein
MTGSGTHGHVPIRRIVVVLAEIIVLVQRFFFDIGQDLDRPIAHVGAVEDDFAGRKRLVGVVVVWQATDNCRKLLTQEFRRAASRADWIAGNSSAIKIPIMAITTSSSTSVKAGHERAQVRTRRASRIEGSPLSIFLAMIPPDHDVDKFLLIIFGWAENYQEIYPPVEKIFTPQLSTFEL